MFAIFLVLSVLAVMKLPKAHVVKGIKPYLIGGCFAFTLFYACDILSLYVSQDSEAKARIFFLAIGMFCVVKYLEQCVCTALKRRKVKVKYGYKELS